MQRSILQVVLAYLQEKHVELNKDKAWSNDWITNPLCSAPQQGNRINCGVFVCMYIDFIHNGCELDFNQEEISNGGWRKKTMLSILPVKRGIGNVKYDDKDNDKDNEIIQIEQEQQMVFRKKALIIISKDKEWRDNMVPTQICWENKSMQIECGEICQGREGCVNKKIQKFECKRVEKRKRKGKGYGLIAMEDIEKDDFIIEYMGNTSSLAYP